MPKGPMPSGVLHGGGSFVERMSTKSFSELSAHWIQCAKDDAAHMGIELRPATKEIDAKVRRIIKASGFHFSETEEHVETGMRIAVTATAMLGGIPEPINIQSLLMA